MIKLNIVKTKDYIKDCIIIDKNYYVIIRSYNLAERSFWDTYAFILFDIYNFKKKFKPWGKFKKWLFPAGYLNYLTNFVEDFEDYVNYIYRRMNNKTADIFKDIKL